MHGKQFTCSLNVVESTRKCGLLYKGVENFDFEPVNQLEVLMGGRIVSRLCFT